MKFAALASALVLSISLVGCATEGAIRGTMDRIVNGWIGAPEQEVVAQWGPPQARTKTPRGEELEWRTERNAVVPSTSYSDVVRAPGGATVTTRTYPGGVYYKACIRRLTVSSGKIVNGDWEGNECCYAAIAGMCRSWINPKTL